MVPLVVVTRVRKRWATRPNFGGALKDTLAVALVPFQTRTQVSLLFEFAVLFRNNMCICVHV